MRTSFFMILSILALCQVSMAQPAITSIAELADNSKVTYNDDAFLGDEPASLSGNGQTWDFTSEDLFFDLMYTPAWTTHTDLSASSHGAHFPDATSFDITLEGNETFYNQSSSNKTVIGVQRATSVIINTDPMNLLTVPFNFGETQSDEYAGDYRYDASGVSVTRKGSYTTMYDGYGTLMLPNETLQNVLRVKTIQDETEIYGYDDHSHESSSYRVIIRSYNWIIPGESSPVFSLVFTEVYNDDRYAGTGKRVYFRLEETVTDVFPSKAIETAAVFPQPASDAVTFSAQGLEGICSLKLYSVGGELVAEEELNASDHNSVTVDVRHLKQGLYITEMKNNNKIYHQKMLIK